MGAEFPWLPISLMIGVFLGIAILIPLATSRFQRAILAKVGAWAEREGIRLSRIRALTGFDLMWADSRVRADLGDPPTALAGSLLFRISAVGEDGRPRKGYLRYPRYENRFAPAAKVVWDSTGPRFDEG